jgi:hypothetical protein
MLLPLESVELSGDGGSGGPRVRGLAFRPRQSWMSPPASTQPRNPESSETTSV